MSLQKIDFLKELFKHLKCRLDILEFLEKENIITNREKSVLLNEQHNQHAALIMGLLENLQREGKLQLVDYEWTILPKLYLKLVIVTDTSRKEFVYSI